MIHPPMKIRRHLPSRAGLSISKLYFCEYKDVIDKIIRRRSEKRRESEEYLKRYESPVKAPAASKIFALPVRRHAEKKAIDRKAIARHGMSLLCPTDQVIIEEFMAIDSDPIKDERNPKQVRSI